LPPWLNLGHLSEHPGHVLTGNGSRAEKFRVGGQRAHKRSPGKFAGGERSGHTVRGRIESFDVRDVCGQLSLEKFSNLPVEIGNVDLRSDELRLC
jgi:hypothetical protein